MAINKATSGFIYFHSTSTTMTTEAMTSAAGNVYQITDTAHRLIDPAVTVTVNHSAGVSVDTTYMDGGIDYFNGKTTLSGKDEPTITGAYLTMTTLGQVVSWSLNPNKNAAETTALGDSWKQYTAIEEGATLTINRYYADTEFWSHLGEHVLVELFEDASAAFWVHGIITSWGPTMAVGQVDNEAITIQVTGPISRG
jgi:hypothetical protein